MSIDQRMIDKRLKQRIFVKSQNDEFVQWVSPNFVVYLSEIYT